MIIGIDFDNTIVSYDSLCHREGVRLGLIDPGIPKIKKAVRDHIRDSRDDLAWQRLQARIYGKLMAEAAPIPGVKEFLASCRRHGARVFIISHKTEYARYDEDRVNLREASLAWLTREGFFADRDLGLEEADVFFESTRAAKIARIGALNCSHFIDDLEEVLLDEAFDPQVQRILFAPAGQAAVNQVKVCRSWQEVARHVFG